jgi:uncharacterized protein
VGARPVGRAAYIDASALVKLFKAEVETAALLAELAQWPVRVASALITVEAICTARRLGGKAVLERARTATKGLTLIPVSAEIIKRAGDLHTPPLRAMDAIHLATALTVRDDIAAMFVYDGELLAAAKTYKLNPLAPA